MASFFFLSFTKDATSKYEVYNSERFFMHVSFILYDSHDFLFVLIGTTIMCILSLYSTLITGASLSPSLSCACRNLYLFRARPNGKVQRFSPEELLALRRGPTRPLRSMPVLGADISVIVSEEPLEPITATPANQEEIDKVGFLSPWEGTGERFVSRRMIDEPTACIVPVCVCGCVCVYFVRCPVFLLWCVCVFVCIFVSVLCRTKAKNRHAGGQNARNRCALKVPSKIDLVPPSGCPTPSSTDFLAYYSAMYRSSAARPGCHE